MNDQLPDGIASPKRGFANQTPVAFDTPAPVSSGYAYLFPAPGSQDLFEPRSAHGQAGKQKLLVIDGAVSGANSQWTGLKTNAPARPVGFDGAVKGGSDYLAQIQDSYLSSQVQMITERASASALFSAV